MSKHTDHKTKEPHDWLQALMPSITDLIFVALFLLLLSIGSSVLLSDADIGWHIKAGEYILKTGSVPREDIFSYTMRGKAWYAWEWLFDVILAVIHRAAGLNGAVMFGALTIALTFTLLFRFLLQRSMDLIISVALVFIAFMASAIHCLARPHIVSWLLTLVWYRLIDDFQVSGKKYLLVLPLIMVIWVNLHGGFLFGILLLALYGMGNILTQLVTSDEVARRQAAQRALYFAVLTAACLLATLANPYGYKLHTHIVHFLRSPITYQIPGEFKSPDFHMLPIKFFELLLILSLLLSSLSVRRLNVVQVLLVVSSIHFALYAMRGIPLAAIIVTPIIAMNLSAWLNSLPERPGVCSGLRVVTQRITNFSNNMASLERRFAGRGLSIAFALVAMFICLNGGWFFGKRILAAEFAHYKYPIAVSQFISANQPQGRVFNTYGWGGILIYELYPEFKVYVDSRSDFYPEDFLQRYLKVVEVKPDWKKVLQEDGIDWIVVSSQSMLAMALKETREWKTLYDDSVAIIFIKDGSKSRN
jgi:hypothetical protein